MGHQNRLFAALLISGILLGMPAWTLAKGGGGGHGGGGHSGGHCSGGGCHSSGGHGAAVNTGSHWGGWTNFGSHGYASGSGGNAGGSGFGWGPYPAYNYGLGLSVSTQSTLVGPALNDTGVGTPPPDPNAVSFTPRPMPLPQPEISIPQTARELIEQGEHAFKAGRYEEAVAVWRHVVIDHPQNGLLLMMLGQALFATGEYQESVFAIQSAMQQLPMSQWGVVVSHYTQLYGDNQDYAVQLRALERALQAKPADPALHFLTGFQYGYLGFLDQAIDQLGETMVLVPHDEATDLLRNEMQIKLAKSLTTHPVHNSPLAHGFSPTLH